MIASLPMYDTASTAAANDRLWQAIRARIGKGPDALDRQTDPHETWRDPALILSQTCGLPYRSGLHGKVQLVGTPDYGLHGCSPGYYRSALVVRADDPRRSVTEFAGARFARNDRRSQSGWAAFLNHLDDLGPHAELSVRVTDTGAHRASAQAVADGHADLAALDAVTWALIQRDTDLDMHLRVLDWTRPTPGLPLITSAHEDAEAMFAAVSAAISALSENDRRCLLLKGIVKIPAGNYLDVPTPARINSA